MKLGRYEVVRELGKGAMGIVYLAKDPLIGRLVALKTIRASAHADDDEAKEFQQRFIREAQAAGILNHPSIVTVHDIGQDEESGVSFIAMEFVEGQNLKEVLTQGRALTFDQIGDIIAQVAEALDFAHAKGIVHRDVKPANVILIEGYRAKITDFGIAKIASGGANLTTTGQFLGTPNYMAPEQIKGAPVDGRTDIFALGICLYECLTRRKPFGGDSLTSISYKIVHEAFPPLQEVNPQIPAGYDEVVANCLAKDPSKRYQRARDLANAVRQVIRGEKPVRPADPMLAEETILTRDRAPGAAAGAAAAGPSLATVAATPTPTVEVPFPDAVTATPPDAAAANPAVTVQHDIGGSTRPASKATGAVAAANAPAKAPRQPGVPIGQRVRSTLTNVRSAPFWRRKLAPAVFIGVVGILVLALIGGAFAALRSQPPVPTVDRAAEARRLREKNLREEGEALLQQGRVTDAYSRFAELQRLAPSSPYVTQRMQQLNAMRAQEEVSRQQQAQAKAKFDEGMVFFNEKKFPDAIARFTEAQTLNPNDLQTMQYLSLAQAEQLRAEAERAARQATRTPQTPRTTTASDTVVTATAPGPASTSNPASLTVIFNHPFTDGRIMVRAGADYVANESLWVDKPGRLFRRASRAPRPVSVTNTFPAKNADLHIWVTVPAQNIQEHHVVSARFEPGAQHRLVVRYDAASKKFAYELN